MKYYKRMLEKGCFTWHDACKMVGNTNSASSLIQNYQKKGYIQSVKRNLYVTLDLVTGLSTVNKFRIASNITEDSYVFGFSALEYYGYANQVIYDVYTASNARFTSFEYAGIMYKHIKSPSKSGIVQIDGVTVTDLEHSILDCINSFEKYGGIEELLKSIELIPSLNEVKLLQYLAEYDKAALYRKTGFILEQLKNELHIGDYFFDKCKEHIGKSTGYLYRKSEMEQPMFYEEWNLVAPKNLTDVTSQGGFENAEI